MKTLLGLIATFCFTTLFVFGQADTLSSMSDSIKEPDIKDASLAVLTPPEGFEVSTFFHGYYHRQASASIVLQEIENASYVLLDEGMNATLFQQNNLEFIERTELKTASGLSGYIYKFHFRLKETDFVRFMVYVGDLNHTLWVNATYNQKFEPVVERMMLDSFQTLHFVTE